jgi:enoyl-CoA hydratase
VGPGLVMERRGAVGRIVFDRPSHGNALDAQMMADLPGCWRDLDDDPAVLAIVVTGRGWAFQTGVDLAQLSGDPDALRASARRTREGDPRLTGWHLGVRKPVVTAVNGVCAGGGLHFVVDSDLVIASMSASFVDPHVSVGQVSAFEPIGVQNRTSFTHAARMAFLGSHEALTAQRAYEIGLIGEVVAPGLLESRAQELALLLGRDPAGVRAVKRAVWSTTERVPWTSV